MMNIDNRKISMYLSWKLPPYYWDSNTYSFSRIVRWLIPSVFTNDELMYIYSLAKEDDETYYFYILEDMLKNHGSMYMSMIVRLDIPTEFYNFN